MEFLESFGKKLYRFIFWLLASVFVGVITGVVGALFHKAIDFATHTRGEHPMLLWLLPLGGMLIVFIYRLAKEELSTNTIIECIRKSKKASVFLAPFIFVSAFITHLLGGSAGREGAALQIGGGIGSRIAGRLKMNDEDAGIMIVCGMSGAFSAIFTTPVTAAILALEIVSVGHIRYFQMLPCIISAICGYIITTAFGNATLFYNLGSIPDLDALMCIKVIVAGIAFSLLSVLFCESLHKTEKLMSKIFKNVYLKAFGGGGIIIALTDLVGSRDYNGAGMDIINNALEGNANYFAFALKIIFTAITVASGFKGGEIVPAFFVGSTFGAILGSIIGIDPAFCASLGLVWVFGGVVNCPIASVILGVELFGSHGIIFYTLVSGICYIVSGRYGLYKSQKFIYSNQGVEKDKKYVN